MIRRGLALLLCAALGGCVISMDPGPQNPDAGAMGTPDASPAQDAAQQVDAAPVAPDAALPGDGGTGDGGLGDGGADDGGFGDDAGSPSDGGAADDGGAAADAF